MGFLTALAKGIFTLFGLFVLFVLVAIFLTWLIFFLLIRKVKKRVEELQQQTREDMQNNARQIDEIIIDVDSGDQKKNDL
jgi:uncharacterized membrane protein YciS (DUF1049 family)